MVQRVEQTRIDRSHPNWKACSTLCSSARKLGNCATYILRHRVFDKRPPLSRKELDHMLKEEYPNDYKRMPSAASAQRQGQVIAKEFKSYAKASGEYKKHPEKFMGEPKLPGYKDKYRAFYVGRNGYRIQNGLLMITGGEQVDFHPLPVRCCENQPFNARAEETTCGDLRIIPMGNCFMMEVTYTKQKKQIKLDYNQAACLDIGVNNFVTIVTTKPGIKPALIKGGVLKSINQRYNKQAAKLREKDKYAHIRVKGERRSRQINDMLHKISRSIVNFCVDNQFGTIVIGYNKSWKQEANLGRRNNQNFVMLPHGRFIAMITYKAEELGIKVIAREESYTSKASSLDFDPVPTYGDKSENQHFSGRRIKRGLYQTREGRLINADVNGAINIGRKEFGDEWFRQLLELDGGVVDTPAVVRDLHQCFDLGILLKTGVRPRETSHVSAR